MFLTVVVRLYFDQHSNQHFYKNLAFCNQRAKLLISFIKISFYLQFPNSYGLNLIIIYFKIIYYENYLSVRQSKKFPYVSFIFTIIYVFIICINEQYKYLTFTLTSIS